MCVAGALLACLVLAGCTSDYGGTLTFRKVDAPTNVNSVVNLTEAELRALPESLRGAVERALAGENVTVDVSHADLDAARERLGCRGFSTIHVRDAWVACENPRIA